MNQINVTAETSTTIEVDNKKIISEFIKNYSIESTIHDIHRVDEYPQFIPENTSVYIAHAPGTDIKDIVKMAKRLKDYGYKPVPHIVARRIKSRQELDITLNNLRGFDVDHILIVAGDVSEPQGPYKCTMDVLSTGILEENGFGTVGVSGHPEGNPLVDDAVLWTALQHKAQYALGSLLNMHIVTQFGFDPSSMPVWERKLSKRGICVPVHLGIAGPTSLKRLINLGIRCGVGASLRLLTKHAGTVSKMVRTATPARLISATASYVHNNPSSGIERVHFFCPGGVENTARWANSVIAGNFALDVDGSSFEVSAELI